MSQAEEYDRTLNGVCLAAMFCVYDAVRLSEFMLTHCIELSSDSSSIFSLRLHLFRAND